MDAIGRQGRGDVGDDGVQRGGADADRPDDTCMLMGAADGDWWEQEEIVGISDLASDGDSDHGVCGQRQMVPVLLEAADRKDSNSGVSGAFVRG